MRTSRLHNDDTISQNDNVKSVPLRRYKRIYTYVHISISLYICMQISIRMYARTHTIENKRVSVGETLDLNR